MARKKENLEQAVDLLKILSHPVRLSILCRLYHEGEMTAGAIVEAEDRHASQSQISQFLASMREQGLVATRREGQVIHYRLADAKTGKVIAALYDIFCTKA